MRYRTFTRTPWVNMQGQSEAGRPVTVALEHVVSFEDAMYGEGTIIRLSGDTKIEVTESYDEVRLSIFDESW